MHWMHLTELKTIKKFCSFGTLNFMLAAMNPDFPDISLGTFSTLSKIY
jgi:hypothetical protein